MHTDPTSTPAPTSDVRQPLRRRIVTVGLGAGLAFALAVGAGCSAPAEDQAAADGRSEATESALAALDPETRQLVEFEAAWQCDLTRFAFDDLSEIDTMRAELQEAQGVSDEDYEAFVDRLASEPDLAALVAALNADCGGNDVGLEGPVSL